MSTWERWLHHPESVWVRKACFHDSPVDRGRSRSVYHFNEHFRQHDCLPQYWRRLPPRLPVEWLVNFHDQPVIRRHRPFRKWHWLSLSDVAVFDGSHYMVAWNQQLAS